MALNPADIAVVSQLLDLALALPAAERDAWLAALPAEHQVHTGTLRDMLAQEAKLNTDWRLAALPTLPMDESVAHADDRVGPYRLSREIGRGGMGSVWLAERADGSYKRQLALKLPRLAWGAGLAERMARERDIGALLEHPNIARLYDAGVDERGRPYLALEFVDGQPIDAWCEAGGLSVRDRLKLFVQVARAVAYAHGRLVVHRDLKPSNVLVSVDGQTHLLDFGIAKLLDDAAHGDLTQQHGRVLTPHYASPEQVEGGIITVASDVYSLGVLLYELLAGKTPYVLKRESVGALEEAILTGEPPLASTRPADKARAQALRGELDAILAKALKRAPGERYATADALGDDIERHLNGDRVLAQPDSMGYRMSKVLRRHWLGVTASAAVLLALLVGFGATLTLYLQVLQAREATEAQAAVARNVNDYLVRDLLAGADPMNAEPVEPAASAAGATLAGQVPVRALLDRAARRAGDRFKGQPALEAAVRMSLGEAYLGNAAYRESADQYRLAHERFAAVAPRQPLAEATALFRAGDALMQADDFEGADQRLDQALNLLLALHASASSVPDSELDRLRTKVRQSQAWLLQKQGLAAEAIKVIQSELPAVARAFGAGSEEMATAVGRLSNFQLGQGQARDAVATAKQALDLHSRLSNPHPVKMVDAQLLVANALRFSGNTVEALAQARKAYEMSRQLLEADHYLTLIAGNILASMLQETRAFDEAIALFEDGLARSVSRYGEDYSGTLSLLNNLGLAYAEAGRTSQAITALKRLLASGNRQLGPDHPDNLITENNLANALADGGRWDEALELQQRVLPRALKLWGPNSVNLGAVHRVLGRLLISKGRWAEARVSLLEARRQFAELGSQHRRVLQVEQMLTELEQKPAQPRR